MKLPLLFILTPQVFCKPSCICIRICSLELQRSLHFSESPQLSANTATKCSGSARIANAPANDLFICAAKTLAYRQCLKGAQTAQLVTSRIITGAALFAMEIAISTGSARKRYGVRRAQSARVFLQIANIRFSGVRVSNER